MTRVLFGTLLTIANYNGTCSQCSGPIRAKEIHGIYEGENTVNHAKRMKVVSAIYCPKCDKLINHAEIYGLEWEPYMFARCN